MDTSIDFLYLDEEDMYNAGVTDMAKCIDTMEETLGLLSDGDYIMGGANHNSHGSMLEFPKESSIPGFPLNDARDRRFIAMPAYIGGKFHIAGQKWYGSNGRNRDKGLPRSILMVTLNDVETGQPLAHMSANLLSSMRTGAIPGVTAKYLAKKDAKSIALIGPGAINKACFIAYMVHCKAIDTVYLKGSSKTSKTAKDMADYIKEKYPQVMNIKICETIKEAVENADIISEAASVQGKNWPRYEKAWFKPGALVISTSTFNMDKQELVDIKKIVDNYKMYEEYIEEDMEEVGFDENNIRKTSGCMGEDFLFMVHDQMIQKEELISLGDIIRGKSEGRTSDEEIILVAIDGMPIEDVSWGYECYKRACENGIGTKLNLWDTPRTL